MITPSSSGVRPGFRMASSSRRCVDSDRSGGSPLNAPRRLAMTGLDNRRSASRSDEPVRAGSSVGSPFFFGAAINRTRSRIPVTTKGR